MAQTDLGPFPPRIIAEGNHSYDLEYQLLTEAPNIILKRRFAPIS